MNGALGQITTVMTAIVGVAILAVLVSKNANTVGVIKATGGAFSDSLRAATSPVSGGSAGNISMPSLQF